MKKLILLIALVASVSFSVFAADTSIAEDNEGKSSISYVNLPILKVLEGRDAYVVFYQKNRVGVGNTVIPKAWSKGNPENPRKLKFRKLDKGTLSSFMTVVKKDGEFFRVILTLPMSKQNSIWGVVDFSKQIQGADKEVLEELAL